MSSLENRPPDGANPETVREFVKRMQEVVREEKRAERKTPMPFDHTTSRVTQDELDNPPALPDFVIDGFLPTDVGTCNGPGGGNKTTLKLFEAIHIILGRKIYGREIHRPGPVLYLSQEDDRARLIWRLSKITDDLALTNGEKEQISRHLYIEDVSEKRMRFVESDKHGNLTQTHFIQDLIDEYQPLDLSLAIFDPLVFFGPGERFVNDGGAEMMLVGRKLCTSLGSSIVWVHHVGIANARDKADDQYSGRGSSALSDGARFVHNLWTYDSSDGDKFGQGVPRGVSTEAIAEKRVMVLRAPKVSHAPPIITPIWLVRDGWNFTHILCDNISRDESEREDARTLFDFLKSETVRYTARTLEEQFKRLSLSRNRTRTLIDFGLQRGWFLNIALDDNDPLRTGRRTHYISHGIRP